MVTLVSVLGCPGSGKSTLCASLAGHYAAAGLAVDHFEERDILTRRVFRPVAAEFADGAGAVRPQTLVESFRRYLRTETDRGTDLIISDAMVPFIPSLVAWGHSEDELARIINDIERVARSTRVIVVLLSGDPGVALQRAIRREGTGWIDGYVGKLSASRGTSHMVDLPTAVRHLRHEADLTRRLLAATGWRLIEVDPVSLDIERLTDVVREQLDLGTPGL